MVYSLSQNVTNTFSTNNLISLLPTVLYILQTALLPIYSKLSNLFGRAQCYTVALTFYMVSYVVMATAQNYYTIVVSNLLNRKKESAKIYTKYSGSYIIL